MDIFKKEAKKTETPTDVQRLPQKTERTQRVQSDKAELEQNWVQSSIIEDDDDLRTTQPIKVTYPSKTMQYNTPAIIKENISPASSTRATRHQHLLTALDISGIKLSARQASKHKFPFDSLLNSQGQSLTAIQRSC